MSSIDLNTEQVAGVVADCRGVKWGWSRSVFCELTDPRPYKNQSPVYGRLIYTVIYERPLAKSRRSKSPSNPLTRSTAL